MHSPRDNCWFQLRTWSSGREFRVDFPGSHPSPEQVLLLEGIDRRFSDLEQAAIAAAQHSPLDDMTGYGEADLYADEVRANADGSFAIFLTSPVADETGVFPMVTFANWEIQSAEWVV